MMRTVQVTKVVCDNEKQNTCTVLSELPVRPTAILDLMKQEQEEENKYIHAYTFHTFCIT